MRISSIYIIFILFIYEVKCNCTTTSITPTLKLKDELFCGYDKNKELMDAARKKVKVIVMVIFKHLKWEENIRNSIQVNSLVGVSWIDPDLTWDPADYNNLKWLYIPTEDIWKPVIQIKDSSGEEKLLDRAKVCQLRPNGRVSCAMNVMAESQCKNTHVIYWPKDELECTLKYETIPYINNTLDLGEFTAFYELLLNHNKTSEWKIKGVVTSKERTHIDNNVIYTLKYEFTLSRIAYGLCATVIFPGLALGLLNLIIPFIRPIGNERLTLCFANTLAHLLYIQHVWWSLVYSKELPLIIIYVSFSFIFAVIATFIGIFLRSILTSAMSMPPLWIIALTRMVFGTFGKYLRIEKCLDTSKYENLQTVNKEEIIDRLLIYQLLDRIFFVTSMIIYSILYLTAFYVYVVS